MMRYEKILLAGNSVHIYSQLSLVTFFVSDYFGKSTVEDVAQVRFTAVISKVGCKKVKLKFLALQTFSYIGAS